MSAAAFVAFLAVVAASMADSEPDLTIVTSEVGSDDAGLATSAQSDFSRRIGKQFPIAENTINARGSGGGRQKATNLVSDIHCLRTPTQERFTAFLTLPSGFNAAPVLEDVRHELLNPSVGGGNECRVGPVETTPGLFALDLSRLSECGARQCEVDDEEDWLCVMVRFPVMSGLMLPEDEVLEIKCKPQERMVEGRNVIDFQRNSVDHVSPTIYLGGGHDFLSEIGLFRQLAGTALFASRVKSGSTIELGENVQLRSIVRAGDGWNFAELTDVVVHRVRNGEPMTDERNTARLVYSDGCRNPAYRVLAPVNPWRDGSNGLINNFDFRVFMFQQMESGDAIMITAKVMACVEEADCAPVHCGDDSDRGYGRRRKRSVRSPSSSNNSSTSLLDAANLIQKWEENLELKIRLPDDLLGMNNPRSPHFAPPLPLTESECKLYLIVTLSVALTFCVLSASIVMAACIKRFQAVKSEKRRRQKMDQQETERESRERADEDNNKIAFMPYLVSPNASQPYASGSSSLRISNGQLAHNGGHPQQPPAAVTPKPVTVRSVKRRDKAKMEEKRMMTQLENSILASRINRFNNDLSDDMSHMTGDNDEEEQAVMV